MLTCFSNETWFNIQIVLIHGLSVPAMIWKDVAPELASRGYRVLLYGEYHLPPCLITDWSMLLDLYGRGYTDAPKTSYNNLLYMNQLAFLMQYLHWQKAIFTGVSMGGGIAAAFTASFPNLVEDKVIIISSAGIVHTEDLSRWWSLRPLALLLKILAEPQRLWHCLLCKLLPRALSSKNTFSTWPTHRMRQLLWIQYKK